jgi:hypothetical protein
VSRRKKGDRKIEEEELTSVEGGGRANHGKGTRQGEPIPQMDIYSGVSLPLTGNAVREEGLTVKSEELATRRAAL